MIKNIQKPPSLPREGFLFVVIPMGIKYIIDPETNTATPIKDDGWIRIPKKWLQGLKGITPSERLTLVVLKSYRGKQGLVCPSLRTLSADTGIGLTWIHTLIKKLEKKNCIKITKTKGKYNTYQILVWLYHFQQHPTVSLYTSDCTTLQQKLYHFQQLSINSTN